MFTCYGKDKEIVVYGIDFDRIIHSVCWDLAFNNKKGEQTMSTVAILKNDMKGLADKGTAVEVIKEEKAFCKCRIKIGATMTDVIIPKSELEYGGCSSMSSEEAWTLDQLLKNPDNIKKPEKKKEKKVKPEVKLKENQIKLSTLTNGKLPQSGVDHIISIYDDNHFPEEMREDIPTADPNYVWNPDVLETLALSQKLNKKCLLTGMPGTGKSTAIKQWAATIKQPYMRFNGKDGIEPSSFLGYPWAEGGGMEWKDGLLPIGIKSGYIVTIDEVFKLPAGIQMAMQHLYEQDGYLLLDDKPGSHADKRCLPHADFRLYLTDNVKGIGDNFDKFAATQIQDTSTLDRFAMVAEVGYLDKADEVGLLTDKFITADPERAEYADLDSVILNKLVQFAGLVRNGYKTGDLAVTLSPRGLFVICELVLEEMPVKNAIQSAFINKLGEDSEVQAVKQMLDTVGIK